MYGSEIAVRLVVVTHAIFKQSVMWLKWIDQDVNVVCTQKTLGLILFFNYLALLLLQIQ